MLLDLLLWRKSSWSKQEDNHSFCWMRSKTQYRQNYLDLRDSQTFINASLVWIVSIPATQNHAMWKGSMCDNLEGIGDVSVILSWAESPYLWFKWNIADEMFLRCKLQILFIDIRNYPGDLSLLLEDSSVASNLNWYLWELSSSSDSPAEDRGITIESKDESNRCFFGGPPSSTGWTLSWIPWLCSGFSWFNFSNMSSCATNSVYWLSGMWKTGMDSSRSPEWACTNGPIR